jgi:hypothetical protein
MQEVYRWCLSYSNFYNYIFWIGNHELEKSEFYFYYIFKSSETDNIYSLATFRNCLG